jgi:hypothetical protein
MAGELFREHAFAANALKLALSPSWTRLEPQSIGGDPAEGLSAAVYDPLWMLGRQWQVGELTGEDAGTPLAVEVLGSATPLRAFAPGDWTAETPAPWEPLTDDVPVEQRSEAEQDTTVGLRAAAVAASALVTTLRDRGLGAAADAVVAQCSLGLPETGGNPDGFVSGAGRVLAGRSADARVVAAALEGADLPAWLLAAVPAGRADEVRDVADAWLTWYRRDVAPPPSPATSWVGHRLEHRFRVSDGRSVLAAPEHTGEDVGWWTFDVLDDAAPQGQPGLEEPLVLHQQVVATPLRFPGMPASRFFELEDAQVDLGAVGADPHDLARLLVIECALVYGGDWLVVPFDVPAGTLVRTHAVTYRTTFGERFLVHEPVAPGGAASPWRMYDVTSAAGSALGALLVPPVAPGRLEGPVLEDVSFLRDEMANLVWAVEHIVEGVSGDPIPVPPGRGLSPQPPPPPPDNRRVRHPSSDNPTAAGRNRRRATADALDYVLATEVPDSWVPYLPHTGGYAAVDLIRGSIRRYGPDDPPEGTPQRPAGRLLTGDDARRIASAEVPRDGVRVQRVPVVARLADGTYRTWVSRRARVGRGEGRSNLAFDGAVQR